MPDVATASTFSPLVAATEAAAGDPAISVEAAVLLVVLVVLGFLGKRLADLGRTVRALEHRLVAGAGNAAPGTAGLSSATDSPVAAGVETEVAVVIAAAVVASLGPSARIVTLSDGGTSLQPWSLEGRRQIFESHHLR